MKKPLHITQIHPLFALFLIFLLSLPIAFYGIYLFLAPNLPDMRTLSATKTLAPITIFTQDNVSIGQFGEKLSTAVAFKNIPKHQVQAFLAAEDSAFFEHNGISFKSLLRAMSEAVTGDSRQSGGSTITMQVAKNYFLSPERTLSRKLTEVFLARQIENTLDKNTIFELYVNKIFLGHHAYGITAAANVYYSKPLNQLTLAEMAMIAGLPKAPSKYNPINNPSRALLRRNWILGRMRQLGFITDQELNTARSAPITLNLLQPKVDQPEPYVAEMVRTELEQKFGEDIIQSGYKIYTTIDSKRQKDAVEAVRDGLEDYDMRHGWRGVEANNKPLSDFSPIADKIPAQVVKLANTSFDALLQDGSIVTVPWQSMGWARKYINANATGSSPSKPSSILTMGDIVRLQQRKDTQTWKLTQVPSVQGQLTALDPRTGAIIALVGGYDYGASKFNRSTQGWRQAGSTIKPFVYSLALERGFAPESIVQDAPLTSGRWRPTNSDKRFLGAITLRKALYLSRNLVSIRLLQAVGIQRAHDYLSRFGFMKERMPDNLTLALGTIHVVPVQMASGYASIANGGYRIQPYFISRIEDLSGKVLFQANPFTPCPKCMLVEDKAAKNVVEPVLEIPNKDKKVIQSANDVKKPIASAKTSTNSVIATVLPVKPPMQYRPAERVMSANVAYNMAGILRDVIQVGTAVKAKSIGRDDLGGKTGTTSLSKDAWFAGFHPTLVAVAWVGFDTPSTLGRKEYGGVAALPVWTKFMAHALADTPYGWVTRTSNDDMTIDNDLDASSEDESASDDSGVAYPSYKRPPLAYQVNRPKPVIKKAAPAAVPPKDLPVQKLQPPEKSVDNKPNEAVDTPVAPTTVELPLK